MGTPAPAAAQRLHYFHGRLLTAADLRREQEYGREKRKLHNRCLHGYGVVCGLRVSPAAKDCTAPARSRVVVTSGLALDCCGNEIVVATRQEIDLWAELTEEQRERCAAGQPIWLALRYAECGAELVRALRTDDCGTGPDCAYGWTREQFEVRLLTEPPEEDERCEPCCGQCPDAELVLARIEGLEEEGADFSVHEEVRRPLGLYRAAQVTGTGWRHGARYSRAEAAELLGTRKDSTGLEFRFSRPVRTDTLVPGVVEVKVIEGGRGRSGGVWHMAGEITGFAADDFTDRFRFRQTTGEGVEVGDQVLITLRAAFVLDRCCRPVDGTHVGGRVPRLGAPPPDPVSPCATPYGLPGPWHSGTGSGGGDFVSWFFVDEEGMT
ncbi:hypothetical protein ACFW93_32190 [Streptomyces canus]|uniref:hypothetical protein n=1 Tax=Streptomyces canus TaxID=58343 RepID=UPI003695E3E8